MLQKQHDTTPQKFSTQNQDAPFISQRQKEPPGDTDKSINATTQWLKINVRSLDLGRESKKTGAVGERIVGSGRARVAALVEQLEVARVDGEGLVSLAPFIKHF